ncbi:proline-, glutamic acid- and leucine-rich protein 1 [Protopterus annectens]|uniref:proline-, glutamic acid- and leucine-rich protein 1 n=1 Tax=Protopterus annectens TaxID=7888 RepID=UPI001CFBA522|nr:proline-, glutamic acid- and leucine-rich protein 1 [Protopterus annectens]
MVKDSSKGCASIVKYAYFNVYMLHAYLEPVQFEGAANMMVTPSSMLIGYEYSLSHGGNVRNFNVVKSNRRLKDSIIEDYSGVQRGVSGNALAKRDNAFGIEGLIRLTNSRLSSVKTRFEGLCLLTFLVVDSPTECFQKHCLSWLRSIQQVMQSQDPQPTLELASAVLYDLLKYSSQLPELAREIASNHIPGILTSLLGLKPEGQVAALDGMRACMTFYPRSCGALQSKLADYFLFRVDAENRALQELACRCYTLLPGLGAGFVQGVKYTEFWERQLHCLLATLHSILRQMFEGSGTDTVYYEGPGVELPFPALNHCHPCHVLQLKQRFTGVSRCLSLLLSTEFSVPVKVPVQEILNLICRILNIGNKNISLLMEGVQKMLILPSLHSDGLEILSSLITACGSRLVRFASVICRLFPQILTSWNMNRGDDAVIGQEKAYSAVRVKCYNVLEMWIKVSGAASGVLQGKLHHSDILLAHLLTDIPPPSETLKLKGKPFGEMMMKPGMKKQKQFDLNDSLPLQSHRKQDLIANSEVCEAALRVLSRAVMLSGSSLKEDTHKKLHELIVPLLIRMPQGHEQSASPYLAPVCRLELYRLLLFLLLVPNPRCPPPLQCSLRIFSLGQNDHDIEVASFCSEALVICNAIIHPRVPCLQVPFSPAAINPAMVKVQMVASEAPAQFRPTFHLPSPMVRPSLNHLDLPLQGMTAGQQLLSRLSTPLPVPLTTSVSVPAMPPCVVSKENHISEQQMDMDAGLQAMPPSPGETFDDKGRRPVFIHYDKEEETDVEISLESDSDDSVVIVPEGLLPKPQSTSPSKTAEETEESAANLPVPVAVALDTAVPPTPSLPVSQSQPVSQPSSAENQVVASQAAEEDLTVININSSDDEEEDEEEYPDDFFEDEYPEEDFDGEMEEDAEMEEEEEEEEEEDELEMDEFEDVEDEEELEEEEEEEDYDEEEEEFMSGEEEEEEIQQEISQQVEMSLKKVTSLPIDDNQESVCKLQETIASQQDDDMEVEEVRVNAEEKKITSEVIVIEKLDEETTEIKLVEEEKIEAGATDVKTEAEPEEKVEHEETEENLAAQNQMEPEILPQEEPPKEVSVEEMPAVKLSVEEKCQDLEAKEEQKEETKPDEKVETVPCSEVCHSKESELLEKSVLEQVPQDVATAASADVAVTATETAPGETTDMVEVLTPSEGTAPVVMVPAAPEGTEVTTAETVPTATSEVISAPCDVMASEPSETMAASTAEEMLLAEHTDKHQEMSVVDADTSVEIMVSEKVASSDEVIEEELTSKEEEKPDGEISANIKEADEEEKKLPEDNVAKMLSDFVDCAPDEEETGVCV